MNLSSSLVLTISFPNLLLYPPLSSITSDPNRAEDEEYIVRLIGRVVTVSVETVQLVEELARAVRMEDWLGESGVGALVGSAVIPSTEV